jgi:hypothetical protein
MELASPLVSALASIPPRTMSALRLVDSDITSFKLMANRLPELRLRGHHGQRDSRMIRTKEDKDEIAC